MKSPKRPEQMYVFASFSANLKDFMETGLKSHKKHSSLEKWQNTEDRRRRPDESFLAASSPAFRSDAQLCFLCFHDVDEKKQTRLWRVPRWRFCVWNKNSTEMLCKLIVQ